MRTLLLAISALLLMQVGALAAEPQTVSIEAEDGFELTATYWPGVSGAGAVLLLHQCNATRAMYERLGDLLSEHGLHVLSLDSRGYGESLTEAGSIASLRETAASRDEYFAQIRPIRAHWPSDVDATLAFLQDRAGAANGETVLAGASCGGVEAVELVGRSEAFAGLVLFSSGIGRDREAILVAHSELPVLFVGSEDDGAGIENRVADTFPRAFADNENPETALLFYKGDAHGYPLFDEHPALLPMMSNWIVDRLKD